MLKKKKSLFERLTGSVKVEDFDDDVINDDSDEVSKNPSDQGPVELADLFCRQARKRISKQFKGLFINDDKFTYKIAQNTLAEKYAWLESDIIKP